MKKNRNAILFLISSFAAALLFVCGLAYLPMAAVFAKTDLSLAETDISFSKEEFFEGDLIRIFARAHNLGDTDVLGYVVFLLDGKEMAVLQPISAKINTYDDVFIDWKAKTGSHNIEVKITGLNPADENNENNKIAKKEVFVDSDTDKDEIGDKKDDDDDNDGLTDKQELAASTNPKEPDTDGDEIKDSVDVFPREKTEWQDTDNDGLGDNKDLDDDNDGIFDFEEIYELGANPKNPDTDNDGLNDKQEIEQKTDLKKEDTDSDGSIDSIDKFPIDPTKTGASLMDSARGFMADFMAAGLLNTKNSIYLIFGAPIVLFVLFFLFRKKKRRR
ncbi:MAG: calcium-binding protein [Parcubacteria group bacterium Licking1014_1]|nr:MAG: calcium-binding protein [Parcubacteria group bacterium Licking1014_1]